MCYFLGGGGVCWLLLFCGFPAGCAGLPFKIISSANEPGENVIVWQFAVLSGIAIFYSIRVRPAKGLEFGG